MRAVHLRGAHGKSNASQHKVCHETYPREGHGHHHGTLGRARVLLRPVGASRGAIRGGRQQSEHEHTGRDGDRAKHGREPPPDFNHGVGNVSRALCSEPAERERPIVLVQQARERGLDGSEGVHEPNAHAKQNARHEEDSE
jgi:hypothetical protein